jgi:hypothetical protein
MPRISNVFFIVNHLFVSNYRPARGHEALGFHGDEPPAAVRLELVEPWHDHDRVVVGERGLDCLVVRQHFKHFRLFPLYFNLRFHGTNLRFPFLFSNDKSHVLVFHT